MQQLPAQLLSEGMRAYSTMVEDLARDVYNKLAEMHPDVLVSASIARSEQHVDPVMQLIEKYGLDEELGPPSVFHSQELRLYNELVDRGSKSLEEALKVGALIEGRRTYVDLGGLAR